MDKKRGAKGREKGSVKCKEEQQTMFNSSKLTTSGRWMQRRRYQQEYVYSHLDRIAGKSYTRCLCFTNSKHIWEVAFSIIKFTLMYTFPLGV